VQGFMLPLEPGNKQKHFLLSSVPTSCGFCVPAGPEGLIEVRSKTPVAYTLEPVVVEGKFAALVKDPYGLFYRVTDALPMP
jgi:Na+-translocating ferredoxin:NAD+ oxidoreductase RNF subunit RnfB